MFDIGFSELVLIAVVGLLVIGPERLPGTVRTATLWLNRLKRGFNDIKREVQQELHNDEVLQELRRTGQQIKTEADQLGQGLGAATTASPKMPALEDKAPAGPPAPPAQPPEKSAE